MPDTRPVMTVTLRVQNGEIKATGVCEDETKFTDAPFKGMTEALRYFQRQYKPTFRVILNVHPSAEYP